MMPLLGLASTLQNRLTRTAIIVLVVLLLAVGLFLGGYRLGWEHKGNAVAAADLKVEQDAVKELRAARVRNAEISRLYEAEKSRSKTVYRTIRQEVPHVVTVYAEGSASDVVRMPGWVVPVGFVRLWNAALIGDLSDAATQPAGAAAIPDPADNPRVSGLNAADLLGNHIDNAEQYDACRQQLGALIAWHKENDR